MVSVQGSSLAIVPRFCWRGLNKNATTQTLRYRSRAFFIFIRTPRQRHRLCYCFGFASKCGCPGSHLRLTHGRTTIQTINDQRWRATPSAKHTAQKAKEEYNTRYNIFELRIPEQHLDDLTLLEGCLLHGFVGSFCNLLRAAPFCCTPLKRYLLYCLIRERTQREPVLSCYQQDNW